MRVGLDTSFDYNERVLYVCIIIVRDGNALRMIIDTLRKALRRTRLHFRKLSRTEKTRVLRMLENILSSYSKDVLIRIIKLKRLKGTNRFSKYAYIERIISYICTRSPFSISTVVVPSDLNTGSYRFCEAISRRLGDTFTVYEDDSHDLIQLADFVVNWYRKTKRMLDNMSVIEHQC